MKMQLFQAANMAEAMEMVEKEFGPEAMIYETRKGAVGIEVVVGIPSTREETNKVSKPTKVENTFSAAEVDLESFAHTKKIDKRLNGIDEMVREISQKFEQLSKHGSTEPEKVDHAKEYHRYLKQLGFNYETVETVFSPFIQKQKNSDEIISKVNRWVAQSINLSCEELIADNNVAAIVGPTGIGKTTTVIKIASRFLRKNSAKDIGIISTDSETFFVKSKLSHFCETNGVDFACAGTAVELNSALKKMKNKKLVMIDTHGISQRDKISLVALKAMLKKAVVNIDLYVALPCSQQGKILEDVVEKFSFKPLAGCVLTKADDCESIIPALSVVMQNGLEIMYICDGKDIEKNIEYPSKKSIMNHFSITINEEPVSEKPKKQTQMPTVKVANVANSFINRITNSYSNLVNSFGSKSDGNSVTNSPASSPTNSSNKRQELIETLKLRLIDMQKQFLI